MITMSETSDEGQECFKIETPHGTYFYQKAAGGFSSLLDKDGNDWLNFHPNPKPSYPASAGNAFRGMPNLVFGGEEDGYGHPGFSGCRSEHVSKKSLETFSLCGRWGWRWDFFDTHAELTMLKVNPERSYWFLYEGTLGGKYDVPHQFWGTDKGLRSDKPNFYKEQSVYENWSWVYMGNECLDRVLVLKQAQPSPCDMLSFLSWDKDKLESNDGMIVFGFGRDKTSPRLQGLRTFYVSLVDKNVKASDTHAFLAGWLEQHTR
ncbi:MAG: hypothetical protein ACRCYY_11565 [Trueperaceae bacterium]